MTDERRGPLLRWDGFHLVADLRQVEAVLAEKARATGYVGDVHLTGAGDTIEVTATVVWKGIRAKAGITIGDIRLRRRFAGFRLVRLRVFGGVRIPRFVVESLLGSLGDGRLTVMRGSGIVIADLREWIPAEADVSIVTVQATPRSLHVWFGSGSLEGVPRRTLALPAGTEGVVGSAGHETG